MKSLKKVSLAKCLCCPEFDFPTLRTVFLSVQTEQLQKSSADGVKLGYAVKTSGVNLEKLEKLSDVI